MKKRQGFTLVELVLAIFLFSYGLISVLQVFPANRRLLAQSSLRTQASFLAQEQIESLRGLSYSELTPGTFEPRAFLPAGAGAFATQFERTTVITLIDSNRTATATDVGLKKLEVTVYWSEGSVAQSYTLRTYANNL